MKRPWFPFVSVDESGTARRMRLSGAREKGYAAPVHSPWRTFFIAALAMAAALAAFGVSSALAVRSRAA